MKHLLATLGLLLAAAFATGVVCYRAGCDPALHAAAEKGDAMEWLRADFRLSDGQFDAIRRLHESYSGTCDEHCRRIQEARDMQKALLARGASPVEMRAADRKLEELRTVCETAIARHVRQVAALMPPEEGRRYLALVLPKIPGFDHRTTPDLHLDDTR